MCLWPSLSMLKKVWPSRVAKSTWSIFWFLAKIGENCHFLPFFRFLRTFSAIYEYFSQVKICAESWGLYASKTVNSFFLRQTVYPPQMRKLGWFLPFFAYFLIICILLQHYNLKQLNEYQPRHPKNKIFSIFAPTSLREAKIEKILFFGYLATVSETATGQGFFQGFGAYIVWFYHF